MNDMPQAPAGRESSAMDRPPVSPRMVALLVQEVEEQRLTIRELRRRVDRLERLASVLLLRTARRRQPPARERGAEGWVAAAAAAGVLALALVFS